MNNFDPASKPAQPKDPFFIDPKRWIHEEAFWLTVIPSTLYGLSAVVLVVALFWLAANFGKSAPLSWSGWAVFVSFWLAFLVKAHPTWNKSVNSLTAIVEKVTGRDLDGNGVVGTVGQKTNSGHLRVMLTRNDEQEMSGVEADLPHKDLLPKLAEGLLVRNIEFSQRKWASIIPQGKFYEIQRAFVGYGLAKPVKGQGGENGYELTNEGKETCRTILIQARKEAKGNPLPFFPAD